MAEVVMVEKKQDLPASDMVYLVHLGARIRDVISCQRSIHEWVNVEDEHARALGQYWTEDRRMQCALERRRFRDHNDALSLAGVAETNSGQTWTPAARIKCLKECKVATMWKSVDLDLKIQRLLMLDRDQVCFFSSCASFVHFGILLFIVHACAIMITILC
jgi:hypothetical protein